jgi:hypothetical protein
LQYVKHNEIIVGGGNHKAKFKEDEDSPRSRQRGGGEEFKKK